MSVKRNYAGYKLVKNTVLDYLSSDGVTTHTATEIARQTNLNAASIRIAAKYMNVILKPGKRGGLRHPANQHVKKTLTNSVAEAKPSDPTNDL
jgi:hypothetical protein